MCLPIYEKEIAFFFKKIASLYSYSYITFIIWYAWDVTPFNLMWRVEGLGANWISVKSFFFWKVGECYPYSWGYWCWCTSTTTVAICLYIQRAGNVPHHVCKALGNQRRKRWWFLELLRNKKSITYTTLPCGVISSFITSHALRYKYVIVSFLPLLQKTQ